MQQPRMKETVVSTRQRQGTVATAAENSLMVKTQVAEFCHMEPLGTYIKRLPLEWQDEDPRGVNSRENVG